MVSDAKSVDVRVIPETPINTKDTFTAESMVTHSAPTLPPATPVASGPAATPTTGTMEETKEAEAVGEEKTSSSGPKDCASEKAEDTAGNDPLPHCDPAQTSDPSLQPGTGSPSAASASNRATTGKRSDSGKSEGDKPVSAPSLLEGMVFYITDYIQSMDATVIQKWKQVCMYVCVPLSLGQPLSNGANHVRTYYMHRIPLAGSYLIYTIF